MHHGQDLDAARGHAIRNDEGRPDNDELPRAGYTAGSADSWMTDQRGDRGLDPFDDVLRGARAALGDIFVSGVKIVDRKPGPPHHHLRQRSKAAAISASVANSPALAWRSPSL